ncbi:DUF6366 family protein [Peribacillus sp. JNUCC 23]
MNNAFYRFVNGNLADLIDSLSWNGTGIPSLLIIIGL